MTLSLGVSFLSNIVVGLMRIFWGLSLMAPKRILKAAGESSGWWITFKSHSSLCLGRASSVFIQLLVRCTHGSWKLKQNFMLPACIRGPCAYENGVAGRGGVGVEALGGGL